jgi:hypothetical protein
MDGSDGSPEDGRDPPNVFSIAYVNFVKPSALQRSLPIPGRLCVRSVIRVTTRRLPPPPPLIPQNRSGFVQALAILTCAICG